MEEIWSLIVEARTPKEAAEAKAEHYKPMVEAWGRIRKRCILEPSELANWALSKACNAMRAGNDCNHPGCGEAWQAYELLRRLRRLEGMDSSGQSANGYIIED